MGTEIKQCRLPVFVCSTYFCTCVLWLWHKSQSVVPYSYGLATTELVLGYRYWNMDALLRLCLTDRTKDFLRSACAACGVAPSGSRRIKSSPTGPPSNSVASWILCSINYRWSYIVLLWPGTYLLDCPYPRTVVLPLHILLPVASGRGEEPICQNFQLKGSSSNWILHRSDYRLILQSDFIKWTRDLIIIEAEKTSFFWVTSGTKLYYTTSYVEFILS